MFTINRFRQKGLIGLLTVLFFLVPTLLAPIDFFISNGMNVGTASEFFEDKVVVKTER